jgi:hypothetical protein
MMVKAYWKFGERKFKAELIVCIDVEKNTKEVAFGR